MKERSVCHSSPCPDLVSFPVLSQIKPQAPLLVVPFRQFLQVSALRPYSPQNPHTLISRRVLAVSQRRRPIPGRHRLRLGLRRYLIAFDPPTVAHYQREHPWHMPSHPPVAGESKNFTSSLRIPVPPTVPIDRPSQPTGRAPLSHAETCRLSPALSTPLSSK